MDREENFSELESRALDIVEAGTDVTADMVDELRRDDELRQLVAELTEVRTTLRQRGGAVDVEARLRLFHARHTHGRSLSRARSFFIYAVAAAAVFAGVLFYLHLRHEPVSGLQNGGVVFSATARQGGVSLTTERGEQVTLSPKGQQNTSLTLDDFREVFSHEEQLERVTLDVPYGKSADITLPDGSVVYLHPGSRVVFPTSFTGSQRVVQLEGQAYFQVARDEARPFIVMAGDVETTVLGTEFNIDTRTGEVTLVSGSIRLDAGRQSVTLTPQQVARLADGQFDVSTADTTPYEFWRDGYLYFDNVELKDIMEAIGANFNMTVEFHNSEALHYKMRFITERNNGVDAALEMMNRMKKVTVQKSAGRIVVF